MPAFARCLLAALSLFSACKDPDRVADRAAASTPAAPRLQRDASPSPNNATLGFDGPGPVPATMRVAETGSAGHPATWGVREATDAPSPPQVFGVLRSDNGKGTYNLALANDISVSDADVSVMVFANGGVLDAGGGPIWRVSDADNYYIARWNPLERNVRLYVMTQGVRTALAQAAIDLDQATWHHLRVIAQGTTIALFVDDIPVLRADDTTHQGPGTVGLWTKADATTLFDDLSVAPP